MQPGPITPWAASIQLMAAAGDSASRLSTTTMSRSSAGPAAAGCPTLAPSAVRNSRAAPDGAWLDSRNSGPGARMAAMPPARWLAASARLAAASDSAVSAATR